MIVRSAPDFGLRASNLEPQTNSFGVPPSLGHTITVAHVFETSETRTVTKPPLTAAHLSASEVSSSSAPAAVESSGWRPVKTHIFQRDSARWTPKKIHLKPISNKWGRLRPKHAPKSKSPHQLFNHYRKKKAVANIFHHGSCKSHCFWDSADNLRESSHFKQADFGILTCLAKWGLVDCGNHLCHAGISVCIQLTVAYWTRPSQLNASNLFHQLNGRYGSSGCPCIPTCIHLEMYL